MPQESIVKVNYFSQAEVCAGKGLAGARDLQKNV